MAWLLARWKARERLTRPRAASLNLLRSVMPCLMRSCFIWKASYLAHFSSRLFGFALLGAVTLSPLWSSAFAAEPIDLALLLDCIAQAESGGVPYPDGAFNIETLPDGTHTVAAGRMQIVESTWRLYTKLHYSWAVEPGHARSVAFLILLDYQRRFPLGGARRLAYAWSAGPEAEPYKRKKKREYADRVSTCYRKEPR